MARWKKRLPQDQKDKRPESFELREIGDLLQKRKTEEALQKIDQKLAVETRPEIQSKLLSLAADSERLLGRFDQSVKIYRKAAELNAGHFRDWIRPRYGIVQALLKDVRVEEAHTEAIDIWNKAVELDLIFEKQLAEARELLKTQGKITILPRPHRRSVVASKLGQMFLSEGESALAKDFFQKAIDHNPYGGCRARQGLATIALREGDPLTAQQRAKEALILGKLQAKTISAWPIYIQAQYKLGQQDIEC